MAGITVGQTLIGRNNRDPYSITARNCPLGTTICGARLYCKSLRIGWFVAPAATQVGATWNSTTNTLVGDKPCVSDWPSVSTALTNAGLTPSEWFVPSISQLQSGFACRTYWDSFTQASYWSSTEVTDCCAWRVFFYFGGTICNLKTNAYQVRAIRCVTY
jgi:hypothetical protein